MLDMDKLRYSQLQQVSRSLIKKTVEFEDNEKDEFDYIVPFPRIRYKKGTLEITIMSDVMPFLLELKSGYTEYYLKESLSLGTFRAKRLYELLSAKKKYHKKNWKVYDITLKGLLNMAETSLKGRPKEFETKIVSANLQEVNSKTSLQIGYERGKDHEGWFTVFKIEEKKKKDLSPESLRDPRGLDEKSKRAFEKLKAMKVREDFIWKIIRDKELQSDFWKWNRLNSENMASGKFRNPAGVLLVHLGLIEPKM